MVELKWQRGPEGWRGLKVGEGGRGKGWNGWEALHVAFFFASPATFSFYLLSIRCCRELNLDLSGAILRNPSGAEKRPNRQPLPLILAKNGWAKIGLA